MKLAGRIIALVIAAVISVLAVQQVIRHMYASGKKYITMPSGEDDRNGG